MSGPKVVDIVTIEERIAACRRLLKRLDAIIAAWTKKGEEHGVVGAEEIAATKARRAKIVSLINGAAIDEAERQLPSEIGFLKEDMERRITLAADKRASALTAERRTRQAAASLLRDRATAGVLSAKTSRELQEASAGSGSLAVGDIISSALRELAEAARRTQDAAIKAAADKFGAGGQTSFVEWAAANGMDDPKIGQMERHIAELEVVSGAPLVQPYRDRLKAIQDSELARRDLLLDSLSIDLVGELKKTRRRTLLVNELDARREELEEFGDAPAMDLVARIDRSNTDELVGLEQLHTDTATFLDRLREVKAAEERRRAVLGALGKLGYAVREGMSTTWEKKGRVLVRRLGESGEGLEIGGPANSALLQMRPVRFDGAGDASASDIEIETRWCGDFANLRATLEEAGGTFRIERMIPVGATPVKAYDVTELEDGQRESSSKTQARALKS